MRSSGSLSWSGSGVRERSRSRSRQRQKQQCNRLTRCMHPQCRFQVHSNPDVSEEYCCKACADSDLEGWQPSHGRKCERIVSDFAVEYCSTPRGSDGQRRCAHPGCTYNVHSDPAVSTEYCCKACDKACEMQQKPEHGPKCEHVAADVVQEPISQVGGLNRSQKCAHPLCQLAVHSCAQWTKSHCCAACEAAHWRQQAPEHGLRCENRLQGSPPDLDTAAKIQVELYNWYHHQPDESATQWTWSEEERCATTDAEEDTTNGNEASGIDDDDIGDL